MTSMRKHFRLSDVHGVQQLAIEGTLGITRLVETLHRTILDLPAPAGKPRGGRTSGITGFVYDSVRGITRVVGAAADAVFGRLAPMDAQDGGSAQRETVLAVLNGVFGDRLAAMRNPLAITMRVRKDGIAVPIERDALASAFTQADGIVVLLHGLCMNDHAWSREGHDHGASLARDEGYAPVRVHYNTGRSLASNGRHLDRLLEALIGAWPHPIRRFAIVGHSMGGLVARAACEVASLRPGSWLEQLDSLVFVGTPHRGAPLERAGAWVDYLVGISPYSAPFARLGRLRSAGIQDLRHGPRGALALPATVRAYAIAASLQPSAGKPGARVRGDGLVPVSSALGVDVSSAQRWVAYGTSHLGLLSSQRVYERMRSWLGR